MANDELFFCKYNAFATAIDAILNYRFATANANTG